MNVLFPPNPDDLFEGAQCNAVLAQDGMWYPCQVEKILSDEAGGSKDLPADLNPILQKYIVRFKHNSAKVTVPLDYIRITRDQMVSNLHKKQHLLNGDSDENVGDFEIPEHLRLKRGDTEKIKL